MVPPGAKYFTKMDAMMGYWQIPLAPESQHLTTFITPWGRYRFKRCPMGFISSGDAFCRRGDVALQGIAQVGKVVDDILAWDSESYAEHIDRVYQILCRCLDNNVTLNVDKFLFAEEQLDFCNFIVNSEGIQADPKKVKAIADFPAPTNLTDLRSFFGLVNQLSDFSAEIADAADSLRPLLSPRKEFIWTADHDVAFQKVKAALVSPPTLA